MNRLQIKVPYKYFFFSLLIILLDQASKVWVHYNMELGYAGQIRILGDWLKLYHVLNPGMAFGIKFGFKYGKLLLTIGRIFACIAIFNHILNINNKGCSVGIKSFAWSSILGGALGNVIDSVFYGVLFDNAPLDSITPWMHGQVIDMILVDLWAFRLPPWVPFFPNQYVRGFPIFNIADTFITVGVGLILLESTLKSAKKE